MTEPSKTARTVGETLRHAREDQNLSLETAAQALHIRARFLQSIEANDLQALPSLAQSRGFLRLYAEYLGLDPQPLLARWKPVREPEPELPAEKLPLARAREVAGSLRRRLGKPLTGEPKTEPRVAEVEEPPDSDRLFRKIGERLQKQRAEQHMSLEEAAVLTAIKVPTLTLLEKMDMRELPSPVIVRGLLENYARVLELDGEDVLYAFAEALQARRDERSRPSSARRSTAAPSTEKPLLAINLGVLKKLDLRGAAGRLFERYPILRKYLTFDLLAGAILVIILLVVIVWASATTLSIGASQRAAQATLPGRSEILAGVGTPTATPESSLEASQPAGTAGPQGEPGGGQAVSGVIQATYMFTLPANADAAFRVTLQPLQTVFVEVWVDDRAAFRGRMEPGASYPFNATRRVELLTGDAGALRVLFNTTDEGILGITGEVVRVVYTAHGPQTITPTVTMTYTPTRRPTATPRPSATLRPTSTKLPTATPRP